MARLAEVEEVSPWIPAEWRPVFMTAPPAPAVHTPEDFAQWLPQGPAIEISALVEVEERPRRRLHLRLPAVEPGELRRRLAHEEAFRARRLVLLGASGLAAMAAVALAGAAWHTQPTHPIRSVAIRPVPPAFASAFHGRTRAFQAARTPVRHRSDQRPPHHPVVATTAATSPASYSPPAPGLTPSVRPLSTRTTSGTATGPAVHLSVPSSPGPARPAPARTGSATGSSNPSGNPTPAPNPLAQALSTATGTAQTAVQKIPGL